MRRSPRPVPRMDTPTWTRLGAFRALVSPEWDAPGLRAALAGLPDRLGNPGVEVLQAGRHATFRLAMEADGRTLDVVVKRFGRQSAPKDIWDRLRGSKALRTYMAADYMRAHAIGTVPPVACLELWRGVRLLDSYFVSLYLADTVCLKDRLAEIWRRSEDGSEFGPLLALVADGVRKLHDAGCAHGDLGNQNIELVRSGDGFSGIAFLDLNRARFGRRLSMGARAGDLARIHLPCGLYGGFFSLYWRGEVPPAFLRAYRMHRFFFRLHGATRRLRHPIRERRYRLHPETAPAQAGYPVLRKASPAMPEGHYTDAAGRRLSRAGAEALPQGTPVYLFKEDADRP